MGAESLKMDSPALDAKGVQRREAGSPTSLLLGAVEGSGASPSVEHALPQQKQQLHAARPSGQIRPMRSQASGGGGAFLMG